VAIHIESSAQVDATARIGENVRIWHSVQIRSGATIGANCIVGRNAYIGTGVSIGSNSKIQNNALVYEPAVVGEGVFIGPGAILTNDQFPRAVNPDLTLKSSTDWDSVGVTVFEGASVGAGAICVAPVTIGAWSMVAAGAVVTKDVPNFALMAGVPAKQIGWVGKSGVKLVSRDNKYVCPSSNVMYILVNGSLEEESAK
jgi:UDP-2-acetamido-3-amino-2,3-dideoxy-glucuronate N-acetyltransferase